MDSGLIQALATGGDVALMMGIYVFWRLERRILLIETSLEVAINSMSKKKPREA